MPIGAYRKDLLSSKSGHGLSPKMNDVKLHDVMQFFQPNK